MSVQTKIEEKIVDAIPVLRLDLTGGAVRGAVVDDDEFEVSVGLGTD